MSSEREVQLIKELEGIREGVRKEIVAVLEKHRVQWCQVSVDSEVMIEMQSHIPTRVLYFDRHGEWDASMSMGGKDMLLCDWMSIRDEFIEQRKDHADKRYLIDFQNIRPALTELWFATPGVMLRELKYKGAFSLPKCREAEIKRLIKSKQTR